MGYQEVFLKSNNNKNTRKLLEVMLRENIRSKEDLFASIHSIAKVKRDLTSSEGTLIKGTELILITGERMYNSSDYLQGDDRVNLSFREKILFSNTDFYPLDNYSDLFDNYKDFITDIDVNVFIKNLKENEVER